MKYTPRRRELKRQGTLMCERHIRHWRGVHAGRLYNAAQCRLHAYKWSRMDAGGLPNFLSRNLVHCFVQGGMAVQVQAWREIMHSAKCLRLNNT